MKRSSGVKRHGGQKSNQAIVQSQWNNIKREVVKWLVARQSRVGIVNIERITKHEC